MNISEYIINKLKELGVNHFFGTFGDFNTNILSNIEKIQDAEWICCTNELCAGFAANGYAKTRGYGALITNINSGIFSALESVKESTNENIPIVSIICTPPNKSNDKDYNIDFLSSLVETTVYLTRDNAKIEIDKVFKYIIKYRKSIVIVLPSDIAVLEVSDRTTDIDWQSDYKTLEKVTEKINNKIKSSEKPLIIADSLIERFNAKVEFMDFVEKSGIPLTNFICGLNSVNYDYKNYLGTFFADFANQTSAAYVNSADCIITIGNIYDNINICSNNLPFKIDSQIAIYGTYTYIDGIKYDNVKMTDVLNKLTKTIDNINVQAKPALIGYENTAIPIGKLTKLSIFQRLQEFIKENDIIVTDVKEAVINLSYMKLPKNVKLITNLFSDTKGWATAAALGVYMAEPNKNIILITNDKSHIISLTELGNMLKHNSKHTILVMCSEYSDNNQNTTDSTYGLNITVELAKLARSFKGDIWSTKISSSEDFDKALRVTKIMNKLCYIESVIAEDESVTLGDKIISDLKHNMSVAEILHEKQNPIAKNNKSDKSEKISLSVPSDFNYGTHTHKSLIELEHSNEE